MPMRIDHHHHIHMCAETNAVLGEILSLMKSLNRKVTKMAGELDRVASEVTEIGSAVDSAVALLGTLSDLIRQNAEDPARLNALADELDSKGNALAAAVAANTPAANDGAGGDTGEGAGGEPTT